MIAASCVAALETVRFVALLGSGSRFRIAIATASMRSHVGSPHNCCRYRVGERNRRESRPQKAVIDVNGRARRPVNDQR